MAQDERAYFLPHPQVWGGSQGMMDRADHEFARVFGDLLRAQPSILDVEYFRRHGFSLVWEDGEAKNLQRAVAETAVALFEAAAQRQKEGVYRVLAEVINEQAESAENVAVARDAAGRLAEESQTKQIKAWLDSYKETYESGWRVVARLPAYCKDVLSDHSDSRMPPAMYATEASLSPYTKLNVKVILAGPHPLSVLCTGVNRHLRNAQSHGGVRFIGKGADLRVRLMDRNWEKEVVLDDIKSSVELLTHTYHALDIALALCKVNHSQEIERLAIGPERLSRRALWLLANQTAWVHGFELAQWTDDDLLLRIELKRLPGAVSTPGGPSTVYAVDKIGRTTKAERFDSAFYWQTERQALGFVKQIAYSIVSSSVELTTVTRDGQPEGRISCETDRLRSFSKGELTLPQFSSACEAYDFPRLAKDNEMDMHVRDYMDNLDVQ